MATLRKIKSDIARHYGVKPSELVKKRSTRWQLNPSGRGKTRCVEYAHPKRAGMRIVVEMGDNTSARVYACNDCR